MAMIFVNLPVKDLEASKRFYGEIGFELNPEWSDETAACMRLDDNIYVMLLTEPKFRQFITGEIANGNATEVLNALLAESREQADELRAKALAAGGSEWTPAIEQGPMYQVSFRDPDGHVWEVFHTEPEA